MKTHLLRKLALALLAGLAFVPTPLSRAADLVIEAFDDAASADGWTAIWGTSPVLSFEPAGNGGAANSGSLRVAADYFTPGDNGWEQMVITKTFETPVLGSDFVSVSVDVKVDPASVPTAGGQYGYFELKRPNGTAMGGVNLTSTSWTTITFNIAPTEGALSGIIIQNGNGGFKGPVIYYLDNFVFKRATSGPPPPKLAITKNTTPGLRLFASAPGQAYQRQNIVFVPSENLANGLWWVNQPAPLTYSITWADFPSKTEHAGFQGHIMLSADSGRAVSPDWNDPNVIMIEFQYVNTAGADGTNGTADDVVLAQARFLHKVNEAASNAMLYRTPANAAAGPVGVLGQIRAPSMLGTWSVAFKNNKEITLTASDNGTLNIAMPDDEAPLYEPVNTGVSALFGVQPNGDARIGLSATISRIRIAKGDVAVVDDAFQTSELNLDLWAVRAQDPAGILSAPPDLAYLVTWNLPDTGYSLRTAASATGPWSAMGTPVLIGARRVLLLSKSALPGESAGFFQLRK